MINVKIWDVTLRDGEQAPGLALNAQQKVRVALLLEELGVDTIEAGFPANREHDLESVKAISRSIKNIQVAAFCRARIEDVRICWEAVEKAMHPRLMIVIPAIQEKLALLNLNPEQAIDRLDVTFRAAKRLTDDITLGLEFGTTAEVEFLNKIITLCKEYDITNVGLADTRGEHTPDEIFPLFSQLSSIYPEFVFAFHGHNDLGLAQANALSALAGGAREIHTTILGLGERVGNTSLEAFAHLLFTRQDLGFSIGIKPDLLVRNVQMIADEFGVPIPRITPLVGEHAFNTAAGIHQQAPELYLCAKPELYGLKAGVLPGPHARNDLKV